MAEPAGKAYYKFHVGQIVHHKRYNYRGVIYERDLICMAGDEWYYSNKSQPSRDQPWYHVLVDKATQMTYVAESNLEPDTSGEPVVHPLIREVFQTYFEGRYHRQNLN